MIKIVCNGCGESSDHRIAVQGERTDGMAGGAIPSGEFHLCRECAEFVFTVIKTRSETAKIPTRVRALMRRSELVTLARELGVRPDWHEPDEQNVTAVFGGSYLNFDNAMAPGERYGGGQTRSELHVTLHQLGDIDERTGEWSLSEPIAVVNLATLFAWATGYGDE